LIIGKSVAVPGLRGGDVRDEASNEGKEPDIAKVCELLDAGTDVQYERCVYLCVWIGGRARVLTRTSACMDVVR
jgi:hypothetical protein